MVVVAVQVAVVVILTNMNIFIIIITLTLMISMIANSNSRKYNDDNNNDNSNGTLYGMIVGDHPETTPRQPGNHQEATRKPQGDTRKLPVHRKTPDLTTNLVRGTSLGLSSQLQSFMQLRAHVRAAKKDFRLCVIELALNAVQDAVHPAKRSQIQAFLLP